MDVFNEERVEFKGVNTLYRDDMLPELIGKDMERRRVVSLFKKIIALTIFCAVAIGFIAFSRGWVGVAMFGGIGTFIAGLGFANSKLSALKMVTKTLIVGKICEHIGWTFTPKEFAPIDLGDFITYGLLKNSDRSSFEDQMAGNAHGASFILHEAHLERKQETDKGTSWVTVFRGVIIKIEFRREFLGKTLVLRDAGIFNRKKRKDLKRVGLVDPKFEKIFEAYGTDQVEARYLLTPTFMQRLVDLETLLSGKKLRAGFIDGELLIAVEAPNQFEAGSMFKPLTDPARVQKVLDEIGTVFDIVDTVAKR